MFAGTQEQEAPDRLIMLGPATASTYNPVVNAILGTGILPSCSEAYERISGAICVREAIQSPTSFRAITFLIPEGMSSTARYITAALLAANHAHANGYGRLPVEECRAFLKNVLLITPAVSKCQDELEALRLAGETPLPELWDVIPLGKHTPRASDKSRVFLANPGWALARLGDRKYSVVILDATDPRTLSRLRTLVDLAKQQTRLLVVVAPALSGAALADLTNTTGPDVWFWDPLAKSNARLAVSGYKQTPPRPARHEFLVCTGDNAADEILSAAHREIVDAMKLGSGAYPGLPLAWSILNRLRSLAVPLKQYDETASQTWAGGLSGRVRMLGEVSGHGIAAWDATWPRVCSALQAAYQAFVQRQDTAKFWVLAEQLDAQLRGRSDPCRVVLGGAAETPLLTRLLADVVDGFDEAFADARIEFVTHSDEARRAAEGLFLETILLAPRPTAYRYLNLYPSHSHTTIAYPFEASIEQCSLQRQYRAAESLQDNRRVALLQRLRLATVTEAAGAPTKAPDLTVVSVDGKAVTLSKHSDVSTDFDIDALAESALGARELAPGARESVLRSGKTVEVVFTDATVERYPVEHEVDVYYEETDATAREKVETLRPGARVIRFVDGRYDSLFERTTEAIHKQLSLRDRVSLELWDAAKARLAKEHPSRLTLYEALKCKGLQSTYATFCSWLRDDNAMAPQQREDFVILAAATGAFTTDSQIADAFRCIQQLRGRNRKVGRKLRAVLRAVISHDGYEEALAGVRRVDPDLADAYAAVDIATVLDVRKE